MTLILPCGDSGSDVGDRDQFNVSCPVIASASVVEGVLVKRNELKKSLQVDSDKDKEMEEDRYQGCIYM